MRWLALLLLPTVAHAFVPDGDGALIVSSGTQPRITRAVVEEQAGAWHLLRDRDTRVVARMWGSYVTVPGSIADAAIAERAARAFLTEHSELAPGARIGDFTVVANRVDDGKRTVAFRQTWRGMRVVGGQVHVVFQNDRLFVAGSEALPNVEADIATTHGSPARAAAWIAAQTHLTPSLRATGERVVLPIVRTGSIEYRVADRFDASARDQRWDVYVAPDGAPIARRALNHAAMSTLQFDVGTRYASGTRAPAPAPLLQIQVDGAPLTTAADGTFSWPTTVAATVVPSLQGSVVKIFNDAGPLVTTSLTAQPGVPVVWSEATNEFADAQLSAYVYANIAKVVGKRIDPAFAWLNQSLDVHVNQNDSCNAFSSGDSIFFYRATPECQNTGRLADVVQHEFGHSFHFQEVIPGVGGFEFSIVEGIADFFAGNIQNDSGIGRGFYYTDDAVREIDPVGSERVYPRDLSPVSHVTGLIISGALWDLRKQLGTAGTEKIFLGIMQRAPDVTMTFNAALVADDDDGNLGNGTPHFCAIESAFGRHGLAGDSFRETTLAPPVVDGRRVTVTVDRPTGTTCPRANVTSMMLRMRGGQDIPMTALDARTWIGELPQGSDGTVLEYQVRAALDNTETILFPDNPADPFYELFVGNPTPIWCETFHDDPTWKQNDTAEWDVAVANPVNAASLDPAVAFSGVKWLGTDLRGDGKYRPDILTSIETPQIDATAFGRVHLQFHRWLAIEDAALDAAVLRVNDTQIWENATNKARTLDHIDKEWRFVDYDISELAHTPFVVSWRLTSDPSRQLGGWNIDDVCVVAMDRNEPMPDGAPHDDDEGCCSGSRGSWSMLVGIALVQLTMRRRRWSRRCPSLSVSERMP